MEIALKCPSWSQVLLGARTGEGSQMASSFLVGSLPSAPPRQTDVLGSGASWGQGVHVNCDPRAG